MGYNKTPIILFGASGFIGGNIYNQFFVDKDFDIFGYSSKTCDLLVTEDIENVLAETRDNYAIIITSSITRLKGNSYDTMVKNIKMVENICNALSSNYVNHITYLSTIDIYGVNIIKKENINEHFLPEPNDYYSVSKLVSEQILKIFCAKNSIPLTILRLPGIYGIGDDYRTTIHKMTKQAFKEKEIVIFRTGDNLRDFVFVGDLYWIIKSAIQKKINCLLNVATGKSLSINEIATLIQELIPFPVKIKHLPMNKDIEKRVESLIFDCTVLKKIFPDVRMTDLKVGIRSYIQSNSNWFKSPS